MTGTTKLSDRFAFHDWRPRTINTYNVPKDVHQKIAFIADDTDNRINSIARKFTEVGLEEFEKENPTYFKGEKWEKFKRVTDDE